ncbi:MAG: hypothetical protein ACJ71J_06240 [Nitrososphaeraceae archaeon]
MSRVTIEVIQNNASPRPSLRLTANSLALATVQMHSRITTKTLLFTAKPGVMSPLPETLLSICRLPFYFSYVPNTEKSQQQEG